MLFSSQGARLGASHLELSTQLLDFLSRQKGLINLDRVALEWRFFFVQFELHRLQQDLRDRYLLPLRLGKSLRGLLLLPDRERGERLLVRSSVPREIGILSLAAAHL